ncbi:MAG: TolC family protein [Pirellulaceae bacterium]|jgi:cobalt-zinc-cadmium efflux system outer membrane protein|nr:TolC family protein [Thermoguttaceae bacterium]NLZ01429.1 TolC family protein [Pirellulaceae bacterium]
MSIRAVPACLPTLLIALLASLCGAAEQAAVPPLPRQLPVTAPLTLADLERIAIESNPTLVQARMAIRAAEGSHLQAGLYPNPTLEYIADEIGNDGSEGLQGGGVTQEIVTNGKRRLGLAVTSHEIQQARHAWQVQRWRVINDLRVGYYEALLAQKTIEVNEQLLAIEEQLLRAAQQLRDAQEVSEVDVLQARVEMENAQLNLAQARDRHLAAWRRLAAVLGTPEMGPAPLAGDVTGNLPRITWEESLSRLLAQSPELAQARAAVNRAECDLALQSAERFPNFEAGAAVKKDTGSGSTVVDVAIGVPLPVFNRNQGNIVRAQAAVTSARIEIRRLELELRERLATAFEQYVSARRRAEAYTGSILPNARRSLELTTTGYREGEFAYLTLLTAQRTYYDTTLNYLASLEEVWGRSVEMEGMLLRGGLQGAAAD